MTTRNARRTGAEAGAPQRAETAVESEVVPTIQQMAARQGVKPVGDLDALRGDFWPDDESVDEFVAAVRRWRDEEGGGRREP